MTDLVFFGAGASNPFQIPTMQEMVAEFEGELSKNTKLYDFYSKIKRILTEEYDKHEIDIESILSVINGIASDVNLKDLGHFVFYYTTSNCNHKKFPDDEIAMAKELQKKLKEYIKKVCIPKISKDERNKAYRQSYIPLFSLLSGERRSYDKVTLSHNWKAYTTNYDNIFEGFWNEFEFAIEHFEQDGNSSNYVFKNKELPQEHSFCKLHGSLDWTKEVDSGRIVKRNNFGFSSVETQGEIMLFPIQQKDLYLHPWFTLFQDLKSGLNLKAHWYVIGYAFNDEFIKNVFQESLRDQKKLVIINPKAAQIKNKFHKSVRDKIDILPIKFGDEFFALQFKDYLDGVKTLVIRLVGDKLHIQCNLKIIDHKILNDVPLLNPNINPLPDDKCHLFLEFNNPEGLEIEIELKLEHTYTKEIELKMSDDTENLDFSIWYGSRKIINLDNIKYCTEEDGTKWMQEPIKLDRKKLYINS